MPSPKISTHSLSVEHVSIESNRTFQAVRKAFEDLVPLLDPMIIDRLQSADLEAIAAHEKNGPRLFRFLERDHGVLLAIAGQARNAVQYEIGNPITATKMTRHALGASLYAPLRITLLESDDGVGRFEYDLPSSLFGQFCDDRVLDVGRYLDRELETVLVKATE
jgi:hypothetical protein